MTDAAPDPGPEPLPPADVAEPVLTRQNRLRLSLVWIVPLIALMVGLAVVVRSFVQHGPDITIEFVNAEGLEAGRTEVRFKEVAVGRVMKVRLRPDRRKVVASVRLDKSAAGLAVLDTRFWVVRPRVGSGGVSGLGTLVSGAYIGVDAGESAEEATEFEGLDAPPPVMRGEPGRSFMLRANDLGSLDFGSPVYYRRIRVGRVAGFTLDKDGGALSVQVFIEAPNENLVTTDTRFWNASGIEVSLSASGLTVNTQSVVSLLAGGIAFGAPPGGTVAPLAPPGQQFRLFDTEHAALAPEEGDALRVRMLFEQSVRGLEPGAPIDLLGIEVGAVRSVAMQGQIKDGRVPMEVIADLYPRRFGRLRAQFAAAGEPAARRDRLLLARLVGEGLRAQLRDGNLITGRMYIGLDFVPKAPPAKFDVGAELPTLPTVLGSFADIQAQLAETLQRVSKVRFDEIGAGIEATLKSTNAAMASLQHTLDGADATVQRIGPEAHKAVVELRQTLEATQQSLTAIQHSLGQAEHNLLDTDAPLQRQTVQTLAELQRAAQAMRALADALQRNPESLLRGRSADPDPTRLTSPAR